MFSFLFFLCVHAGIILFKNNLFSAFVHKHDLMLDCTILKIAKLFSIVPSMMAPTTGGLVNSIVGLMQRQVQMFLCFQRNFTLLVDIFLV